MPENVFCPFFGSKIKNISISGASLMSYFLLSIILFCFVI